MPDVLQFHKFFEFFLNLVPKSLIFHLFPRNKIHQNSKMTLNFNYNFFFRKKK